MRRLVTAVIVCIALVVAVLLAAGMIRAVTNSDDGYNDPDHGGHHASVTLSAPGEAIVALERLERKGRAPKTGYSRSEFGPTWKDVDGNGCDTRNDILARDLDFEVLGSDGCTVESGTLEDPYTDSTLSFQRGSDTSRLVQIDHVVALGDAWQKGAQGLDSRLRTDLANDPLNLFATEGAVNASKGDADAATWLPPNRGFRCVYVAHQISVKEKYNLWVTPAEYDAMAAVLSTCPEQPTYS